MFVQFQEGGLWSETCVDVESGNESDDNSIIPTLISKEEMDAIDSGNESEDELMSMDTLKDIHDGNGYLQS